MTSYKEMCQRISEEMWEAWRERGMIGPPYPDEMPTRMLETSVRVANVLQNNDLDFVWQARQATDAELLRMPNFGKVSLAELRGLIPHDPTPPRFPFQVRCYRCATSTIVLAHPNSSLDQITRAFCAACQESYDRWLREGREATRRPHG
jgi:hypothetical protein